MAYTVDICQVKVFLILVAQILNDMEYSCIIMLIS
jgi:hypothetical protein